MVSFEIKNPDNQPKNPLQSRAIQGLSLISGLELLEIATGDPFSLNGAIKLLLWSIGAGLIFQGRWMATKRLSWQAWDVSGWPASLFRLKKEDYGEE